MARQIGKFEVQRLLGKGAQSAVYLCFDPVLRREVAIKTLQLSRQEYAHRETLLNEARTVSKLRHANIVPVFDAGEHDSEPYLVFEYVQGPTLAQLIRTEGPLPADKAGKLMLEILDAIECAHRADVIHRDLKPSNVLVDAEGVARVMDFGIATRVAGGQGKDSELQGTPSYMAPEYIAHRTISPQIDVFAAGLILYEMVFGKRAVEVDNVFQAMHRIANTDIHPPVGARQVDEKLFDIITKATARNPQMRYQSAAQMREALDQYLNPQIEDAPTSEKNKQSTIDFLMRRMRHKSDFPAMSVAISAINRLAASEKGTVHGMSNSILQDFALTNKILRIANSALYRQFGAGSISTISRAIAMLGFDAVRNIALSLMLFEHMQNKQHASMLREEFLRANLSGVLGKQFAEAFSVGGSEEPFICCLFHNLGRLLTHYYFPEEAETINKLQMTDNCSEEVAAARVLGIGFQDLGMGIAENWGFPELIVQSMRRPPPGKIGLAATTEERLRLLSSFSNEVATVFQNHPADARQREIKVLQARYGDNVHLSDQDLSGILKHSTEEITALATTLGINIRQTRIGKQLLLPASTDKSAAPAGTAATPAAPAASAAPLPKELSGLRTAAETAIESAAAGMSDTAPEPVTLVDKPSVLSSGIQDITGALVDGTSLNDLLRIILETMYRAMGFKRVLLCMRETRNNTMSARFGFGDDVEESIQRFRFPLGGRADIFNIILANDKDVLISDASDPKIARFMPDWFKAKFPVQTFIVFPLRIKGQPVAMIYADADYARSIVISDKELSLLRTLCNQAVLAIRQAE